MGASLNRRRYMGGGGSIVLPIPYISDGLVAAWDGEYNTGTSHDGNASNWVDCVGGLTLTGVNSPGWGDKYALFDRLSSMYFSGTGTDISNVFRQNYVEVVVELSTSLPNVYRIRAFDTNSHELCFHSIQGIKLSTSTNNSYAIATKGVLLSYHIDFSTYSLWENGVALTPTDTKSEPNSGGCTIGASLWRGNYIDYFDGKIYCVRIYNRQLTAEEIVYNYNIDVQRFGT